MSEKKIIKPVALAVGVALAGTFAISGAVNADVVENPFSMSTLSAGYMLGAAEGSCGAEKKAEGSCGEDKKAEGSCGEGSCGADKEHKDAEGSCGEDKKAEGSCGEGSCGADAKEKDGEGSCGADTEKKEPDAT